MGPADFSPAAFWSGLLVAFFAFVLLGAQATGECPRVGMNIALVLPGRKYCLHLHHWILGGALALLILGVVCLSGGRTGRGISVLLGGCAGTVVSGFLFEDAMDVVQLCTEAQPC